MRTKTTHTAMLLAMLACTAAVTAETLEVRIRIHQKAAEEKTINRENLIRIKQSILQHGQRTTYCNAYNNNPSQHTKRFYFYLNPDSGQDNIDCDPIKSDFNSLTIRSAGGGKNQYRTVGFIDNNYVHITANNPTDDLTVSQVRQFVEDALQEILAAIEAGQAPGGQQPFDEVLWVERPKPEISLLYLVLTNTGGHDESVRLVVRHAAAALREAEKHQGHAFNVVYFVRPSGMYTGFSVEQLREIAGAAPQRAEELVGQHAWSLGELPKPAAQGGAIRLEQESTAPTPRDINGTQTPMGRLGHPIGTYMQVEGVRAEAGKVGVKTLAVEKINGKKLSQPVSVWIDNVDLLPEGKRCVLAGYESGKWIGTPPDVIKYLGDVAVAQAPWQFRHIFLVISADEPVELSGKFPSKASGEQSDPRH